MVHAPLDRALQTQISVRRVCVATFDLVCPCNIARKYQGKLMEKQMYTAPFNILERPPRSLLATTSLNRRLGCTLLKMLEEEKL
jgi:hypothetical protein